MIVWTAPQNTQVADALERLKSAMPNKKIVRLHSCALELRSFMDAKPEAPESTPITKDTPALHKRFIKLVNKFRLNQFEEGSPAADPHSWSSQLRAKVKASPKQYHVMITNWRMQDEDPVTFRTNRRDYLAEARTLMNDFITDADVVSLMTMFNHIEPVSQSLFIVDEVGRLTEAMTFVASA